VIVVAYALGAIVAVAAVIAQPGTIGTIFPIVVTAASVAIAYLLVLIWRRAGLRRAIADMRRAESVVVTGMIEAPRTDVAELIAQLRRLGFATVGATDTSLGGGDPIRTWILTESTDPATTWVEVGIAPTAIAVFLSRAANGRFLETPFHRGEMIDHPDLFVRPVWTGVDDALREHREVLADWESQSGPPLAVRTLEDYRTVETELRDRTGGMRIAAYLRNVIEPSIRNWAVCAVIATAAFLVVVLLPGP
jgi:hypothetical protein